MNNYPIFMASDENYAPFITTVICSACENTSSFLNFYIIDNGITQDQKNKIQVVAKNYSNASVEFLLLNIDEYVGSLPETQFMSKAMYSRYLIPFLKPELSRAVYTDVDVVITGDISQLFFENLDNFALGAVWEDLFEDSYNVVRKKELNLSAYHKYFSSGLLLFDCEQWRIKKIANQLFSLNEKFKDKIKWPDQDILNIYFDCNYKRLDSKYCILDQRVPFFQKKDYVIRHYTGNLKPWKISPKIITSLFPDTDLFWYYMEKTPFYNEIVRDCVIKSDKDLNKYRVMQLLYKKRI